MLATELTNTTLNVEGPVSHSNKGFLISFSLHYGSQNTYVSIETKHKLLGTRVCRFHVM
jgi:hypothetical protein